MILDREKIETAAVAMMLAAGVEPHHVDILSDDRYTKQVTAFVLALSKNVEREGTYDGLWQQYGIADCAHNARMKAQRIGNFPVQLESQHSRHAESLHDDAMDDALDLINYGAFCARLIDASAKDHGLQPSS